MVSENVIHPEERLWWSFANPCTDEQGQIDETCCADRMLDRIVELEAENAALRDFVSADDALDVCKNGGLMVRHFNECYLLAEKRTKLRQRLATDHGLPLPAEGKASR